MSQLKVCCVMLTADRPELARRAVECYLAQDYQEKRLYIYDSGLVPDIDCLPDQYPDFNIAYHRGVPGRLKTIGELRNYANRFVAGDGCEVIVHWDSDDHSHPQRITEQVALLQSSGAGAVGYRELLFWDQRPGHFCGAWLFRSGNTQYCCGTSLCYWREIWQQRAFPATNYGEETEWLRGVKARTVPSWGEDGTPRMIARIHGGNTSHQFGSYDSKMMEANAKDGREWSLAPEWDEHCRRIMS